MCLVDSLLTECSEIQTQKMSSLLDEFIEFIFSSKSKKTDKSEKAESEQGNNF